MNENRRDNSHEKYVTRMMIIACIAMIVITILTFWLLVPKIYEDKPGPTTVEEEAVMAAPKVQAITYEPKAQDVNVYFRVDGTPTADEFVNVRNNPGMSDKNKVGRLSSGTTFVADKYYVSNEFYGFPVDALKDILDVEDEDGILWMSQYYVHAAVFAYPECAEEPEKSKDSRFETEFTTLTIVGGSPKVRATPTTDDMGNVYGEFPEGTVIKTSAPIIVDGGSYTFYGIRVADTEGAMTQIGYGHLWYDPDNIVWISSDYAKVS